LLCDPRNEIVYKTIGRDFLFKSSIASLDEVVFELIAFVIVRDKLNEVVDLIPLAFEKMAAQLGVDRIPFIIEFI